MTKPDDALVGRMVAVCRSLAGAITQDGFVVAGAIGEARAIVAELPEPVDPDLLTARQLALDAFVEGGGQVMGTTAKTITCGDADGWEIVQSALKGIKRGRSLAALDGKVG